MTAITLRYASHGRSAVDVPTDRLVAVCGAAAPPLADVAQATAAALAAPLDYPSLAQSVVPGDKVCIALADGVPGAGVVVATVIAGLKAAGVSADDVTVICASAAAAGMVESASAGVAVLTHDPTDRRRLAYLAASAEGKSIYMDRGVVDADLVIPIGCQRLDDTLGYFGLHSALFPAFSDAKSLERYRAPLTARSPVQLRRMQEEARQVAWLLGVPFFVQVIPAGDDGVLAVLAGQTETVERTGRQRCEEQWKSTIASRADLVVATLSGSDSEQTWLNFARALAAALRVVEEGGAIVVCSDLREAAGPAVRWLAATESPETALREIVHERPADALAAAELLEAVSRARVYLLSGLPPATVEDIGLSPIEGGEQLQRLIAQHSSCIVLDNAQYVVATPAGEQDVESLVAPDRQRTKRR